PVCFATDMPDTAPAAAADAPARATLTALTSNAWGARASLLAISLLATLPVWIPPYPQMADLPQHAAQVQLLRSLQDPAFSFAPLFHINWFTPYLAGYLLVYLLVPLLGIVGACKTVIALSVAATPLATALLARETGADGRWAPLTVLGLYGFSFQWGFLNFLFAIPLGLAFLCLAARHARAPRWWTWPALAVSSIALFFCHALVCALFCVIAGCWTIAATRSMRATATRLAPAALVVPVAAWWTLRTMGTSAAHREVMWDLGWVRTVDPYYRGLATGAGDGFLDGWGRLTGLFPRLLGVRPSLWVVALAVAAIALPLLAGAQPAWRRRAIIPLIISMLAIFLVPSTVFGADYTYQRFTVFTLPFFLATLGSPTHAQRGRWARRLVAVLVVAWIGFVSARTVVFTQEARGFQTVLSQMEPRARVLSMAFIRESEGSLAPSFLHFGSWYSALSEGVTDPSFAVTHVQLVLYKPESRPKAGIWGFEWQPWRFNWKEFEGWRYRYFLVHDTVDRSPFLAENSPCTLVLRARSVNWWLYERGPDCPATPSGR
ncbi:MAG TPA: hypothetical protein VFP28_09325, partial [Gemmatimonadales bacterium]|nr:hypothetical protein [Gemmatimonadales bacterium]